MSTVQKNLLSLMALQMLLLQSGQRDSEFVLSRINHLLVGVIGDMKNWQI